MSKYKINWGDTLSGIASKVGSTVSALMKANNISNPDRINAGDTLEIPDSNTDNSASNGTGTGFTYKPFDYEDFQKSGATIEAEGKKSEAQSKYDALVNEGVNSEYKGLADQLLKDYMNREDFSYDFNGDALYQQYKDKYIKQGKMAMQDTIGQASAMTGGYGNSYAATAGNQAYQASLENLNDIIPELYQMAYDRYNQKGQDMLNQYSLASDAYSRDYGEYMDKLGILDSDRSYWGTEADNAFNRDWGMYDSNRTFEQGRHDTEQGYLYQTGRDAVEDARKERELQMAEEEWGYKKKAYEDGLNSGGTGGSGGSGSGTGGSGGSGGNDNPGGGGGNNISTIPSYVTDKLKELESNTAVEAYLENLEASGAIGHEQALQLMSLYMDNNEKYISKDDGTKSISYKDMVGSTNGWKVENDGDTNWFWGVDNNAIVRSPNGEQIRLDDLVDKLVSEGMSKSDAKAAVKKLQKNLGI